MRIFIQNCKTKLFLKANRCWTNNLEDALSFESGTGAIRVAEKFSLRDVALLYAFANPDYDFVTALSESCR